MFLCNYKKSELEIIKKAVRQYHLNGYEGRFGYENTHSRIFLYADDTVDSYAFFETVKKIKETENITNTEFIEKEEMEI